MDNRLLAYKRMIKHFNVVQKIIWR